MVKVRVYIELDVEADIEVEGYSQAEFDALTEMERDALIMPTVDHLVDQNMQLQIEYDCD